MKLAGRDIKVFNLVFCGVGIAILLLIGIYPAQREIGELDRTIAKLEADIEGQKLLFPVFTELLKRSRKPLPAALPAPEPQKLPRGDTSRLAKMFKEAATETGIQINRLTPNVESLIKGGERLKMEAEFTGSFHDFRAFLIRIGAVPYLVSVELLRLQSSPGGGPLTATMTFWVLQG